MRTILLLIIFLVSNFELNAQVGINTNSPKAELDVRGEIANTYLLDVNFSDDTDGISTSGSPSWTVQNYLDSICFSTNNTTASQVSEVGIDLNIPEARSAVLTFDLNVNLTQNGILDINKQIYTSAENTDWTPISIPLVEGINKVRIIMQGDGSANFPGKVAIDNVKVFYPDGYALRISDSNQEEGYVLTSDMNGNATWRENRLKVLIDNDEDTFFEVLDANAVKATIKNNETFYLDGSNFNVDVTRFNIGTLRDSLGNMKWGLGNVSIGNYSTVWGGDNRATGDVATVWGNSNEVSGLQGTAWGRSTSSSAAYATAWGRNSKASGEYSTAFGYRLFPTDTTEASAGGAVAWGINNKAEGLSSTAFGWNNQVLGPFSHVHGSANVSNGAYSNVGGFGNNQVGNKSTVFGNENTVNGDTLMVWGNGNTVTGKNVTTWGTLNITEGVGTTAWGNSNQASGFYSTAFGRANIASGSYSLTSGESNRASEYASIAFGGGNRALGTHAFVWGRNNFASSNAECQTSWGMNNNISGSYSTVFGRSNDVIGDTITVWGSENEARGQTSTAWGKDNSVSGIASTAWGESNTSSNYVSTVWGFRNTASGNQSTAWGRSNKSTGNNSTTWGQSNNSTGVNATAWGIFNEVSGADATAWGSLCEASSSFSTAFGLATESKFNAMVSLGRYNNDWFTFINNWENPFGLDAYPIHPILSVGVGESGNRADGLTVWESGQVVIGYHNDFQAPTYPSTTVQLTVLGEIEAAGYNITSDRRLKSQIRNVDYGLKEVLALHPKLYDLHKADFSRGKLSPKSESIASIGLIAQDVYEIVPEAVYKPQNEDMEAWHIDYTKLVPVLINALKDLDKKVESMDVELSELRNENKGLKERIEKLETLEERILALEKVN